MVRELRWARKLDPGVIKEETRQPKKSPRVDENIFPRWIDAG